MKAPPFAYARPETIDEALQLLDAQGDDAAILAGGQSLMPMLALRLASPAYLIDINRVAGLNRLIAEASGFEIGALARQADLLRVTPRSHLFAKTLPQIAHAAIRNRGTVCGSVALADPAAELPACLLCLDAEIDLASNDGERTVQACDFFKGLYATARGSNEMIHRIRVPPAGPGTRYACLEVARRHGDYAILGMVAAAQVIDNEAVECRIVAFAAGDMPQRLRSVEAEVEEGSLDDPNLRKRAGVAVATELAITPTPLYDEAYKRRVACKLIGRVLDELRTAEPLQ